mgnify:CR=1 FL=1
MTRRMPVGEGLVRDRGVRLGYPADRKVDSPSSLGDELESLRQIHGWHWCRSAKGDEGWVAGYLLKPAP